MQVPKLVVFLAVLGVLYLPANGNGLMSILFFVLSLVLSILSLVGLISVKLIQLLTAFFPYLLIAGQPTSTVTIPGVGNVEGLVKSYDEPKYGPPGTYYQYQGIPYANSVDRFELAEIRTSFSGAYHDGRVQGKVCPQVSGNLFYLAAQDEKDCLLLTITTPRDPQTITTPLPVLVFFYGGAFLLGSIRTGWYDPQRLVREDIVVVNVQYRLGVLGWLTDNDIIPKNIGLKDCRLALEWVQQHIHAFGGDPTKVTINGESAGSIITAYLWQSARTQDLFRSAFLQSGTNINTISYQADPELAFDRILLDSACAYTIGAPPEIQVDCLKTVPVTSLGLSSGVSFAWYDIITFGAIDGGTQSVVLENASDPRAIVIEKPLEQLTNGTIPTNKPVMISITSEELLIVESVVNLLRGRPNSDWVPEGMNANDPNFVGALVKTFYGGSVKGFDTMPASKLTTVVSDLIFNNAFRKFVEQATLKMDSESVYCMQFSYVSSMGIPGITQNRGLVGHAGDLLLSWRLEDISLEFLRKPLITQAAYDKSRQYNKMVANFVKYNNPTPVSDPTLNGFMWPAVSNVNAVQCMNFDTELGIILNPKDTSYQFWNNLYNTYGPSTTTF